LAYALALERLDDLVGGDVDRDAEPPPARLVPDGPLGRDAAGQKLAVVATDRRPAERTAEPEPLPVLLLTEQVAGVDRQGEADAD
jgi:hypothetical protein